MVNNWKNTATLTTPLSKQNARQCAITAIRARRQNEPPAPWMRQTFWCSERLAASLARGLPASHVRSELHKNGNSLHHKDAHGRNALSAKGCLNGTRRLQKRSDPPGLQQHESGFLFREPQPEHRIWPIERLFMLPMWLPASTDGNPEKEGWHRLERTDTVEKEDDWHRLERTATLGQRPGYNNNNNNNNSNNSNNNNKNNNNNNNSYHNSIENNNLPHQHPSVNHTLFAEKSGRRSAVRAANLRP